MSSQIEDLVLACSQCLQLRNSNQKEPMSFHEIPELPRTKIGCDIFEINGKPHIAVIDYYSKFIEMSLIRVSRAKLFRLAKFDGFLIYDSLRIAMLNLFSFLLSVWDIVSGATNFFFGHFDFFWSFFLGFPSNLSCTQHGFGKYTNFDIFNYYLKAQIGRKTVNI